MPGRFIGHLRQRLTSFRVTIRRTPGGIDTALAPDHPLDRLAIAVMDTETTGLNTRRDRIVSIAGLLGQGGELDPTVPLDLLVNPGQAIPALATSIHGISNHDVAHAPHFGLIWPHINAFWEHRALVGHNIGFDLALLRHETERAGIRFRPPAAALDVGLLFAGLRPRATDVSLDGIAQFYAIESTDRHTALGDSRTTAAIWQRLIPELAAHRVDTLGAARQLMRKARDLVHRQQSAGWDISLMLPHEHHR